MAYSLFETAELGPLISKNRTVRSATNEHLSDPSGQITPAWVDSLEALARGGVGIIITGHLSVDRDQLWADEGQAVLDQETDPTPLSGRPAGPPARGPAHCPDQPQRREGAPRRQRAATPLPRRSHAPAAGQAGGTVPPCGPDGPDGGL